MGSEEWEQLQEVMKSGHLFRYGDLGDPNYTHKVYTFEQELARRCNVKHALAVTSGSAALISALKAIDLEPDTYRPNLVRAYLRVAERHNQRGDRESYILYLRKAVEESPDSASLHYRLAGAFLETGDREGAVRAWRAVLELQEDHPDRLRILNLIAGHSA